MSSKQESKTSSEQYTNKNINTGGLYGDMSVNQSGMTYNPNAAESQMMSAVNQYLPSTIEQLYNPTYDSTQFQNRMNQLNSMTADAVQSNIVNPLYQSGLSRGSSSDTLAGVLAGKTADLQYQAMADEDARNQQQLASLLGLYQTPLSTIGGLNSLQGGTTSSNSTQTTSDGGAGAMGALAQLGAAGIGFMAGGPAGAAVAGSAASDKRLKENIELLDEVEGIKIYSFNYIGKDEKEVGVIAQEQSPDVVIENFNGTEFMGVDYSKLPQAVQERIEELKV